MTIYLKQFTDVSNVGDAASSMIASYISGEEMQVIGAEPFGRPNLIAIGSILHWADANSIIWGSGFISDTVELPVQPKAVAAVRGRLSHELLKQKGVKCPLVFGDPGVFIADLVPQSEQTISLGVVPHYVDVDEPFVRRAREFGAEILDVLAPLDEFIRKLSSCRKIITSSLHGLVFAHAYGIPAVWVKLSPNVVGNGFKFRDYYTSIGVEPEDIPALGPDDPLSTIEQYCSLPATPIDRTALRRALLDALPVLKKTTSLPARQSTIRKSTPPKDDAHQQERITHVLNSLRPRIAERISRSLLFDPDEYLSRYEDLRDAAVDAYDHYISWGLFERRNGVTERTRARVLGSIEVDYRSEAEDYRKEYDTAQAQTAKHADFISRHDIAIYVHSNANYYMHPIAAALAHAMRSSGVSCRLASDRDEPPASSTIPIIVAPHEFFGEELPEYLAQPGFLTRSVLLNTEHGSLPGLLSSLPWLYSARGILDLGFQTSCIWRRGGIPAAHVLPPFDASLRHQVLADFDPTHPLVNWISPDILDLVGAIEMLAERPLDIFFAGHPTQPRNQFLLRNAAYFAQKNCFLAYPAAPNGTRPLDASTRRVMATNLGMCLLSKCVLNLSRFSIDQFHWERNVALGLSCDALVVTTPCLRTPFFEPNVDYLEANPEHLDLLIPWLLDSTEGLASAQAVVKNGREVLRKQLTPQRMGRYLLSFLADLPP